MRSILTALTLVVTSTTMSLGQTPSATDLATKVQAHYDTIKDFQAEFTQVYKGGFTKPQPPQTGTVRIKKPGRMFWKWNGPEKIEIWSDGSRLYTYLPASKQGSISALPTDNAASTSLLFLMDRSNLPRDFTASLTGDQPAGEWRLSLVPKRPDPEITSLVLVVDRSTLRLRGFETTDGQGGTNIVQFRNLRENVGLRDQDFVKNPLFPKDTKEIIR